MSRRFIQALLTVALLAYSILAFLAAMSNEYSFLFVLGLPWSMVASLLSPLIGHAFGLTALYTSYYLCLIANFLLLLIQTVKAFKTY